jgi:cytochrome bd ubiquinol oxidase subunit II
MAMSFDLTTIWALILALAIFIYVVLDGFDLGIGILYPAFPQKRERDLLMNTVAPVWDGNETWLVLGGGGLLAAFPLAYAILMPALYPLIIAMLLGLVFRGVAFEYRWRTRRLAFLWDMAFFGGSLAAAMAQGMMLGAILQGIKVNGRSYAGGWWDWLTPFTLLTGVAVVVGYALLGATYLVMKTGGEVRQDARRFARVAGLATLGFIVAVSLWTPFLETAYWQRWFAFPQILITAPVPVAVAALGVGMIRSIDRGGHDAVPFVLALGIFLICMAGLGISMWPWIVPGAVSIFDAAAPAKSQSFMLVGTVIMLPIILGYTAFSYWVFRGKVDPDKGYH